MSKPPPTPTFGLAIDWETSGYSMPNYAEKHQGITFGAVVFNIKTFEPVKTLYCEVKFDSSKYSWEDGAQKVHGLSREHLEQHGVTQEEAATQLLNLVIEHFGTEKVMLLGHRVYFDEAFTNQLTATLDIKLDLNPIRLDSAALGMSLLNIERSDQLFEWADLPPRKDHNAQEDILYTLASVKKLKDIFEIGRAVVEGRLLLAEEEVVDDAIPF